MKLRQCGLIILLIIVLFASVTGGSGRSLAMSPWGQEPEPAPQTFGQKGDYLVRLRPGGGPGGADFYLSQVRSSLLPVDRLQAEEGTIQPVVALALTGGALGPQEYQLIVPEGSIFDPALPWIWEYIDLVEFSVETGQYTEEIKRQLTLQAVITYPPSGPDGLSSLLNFQQSWLQANPEGRFWIEALLTQEANDQLGMTLFPRRQPELRCETAPPAPPGTVCAISDGSQTDPILVFRIADQPLPQQEDVRLGEMWTEQQRQEGIILALDPASNQYACYLERGECLYRGSSAPIPKLRCERDPLEYLGITCMVLEKPDAETVQFFTIAPPLTLEEKDRLGQMAWEELQAQGILIADYPGGSRFACFIASGECRFWFEALFIPAFGDRERHTCSWFASLLGLC